ncbi:MAG: nucleotidyltransferase domain-containing protein [Patescibacteria group bacterium]|jgi:predicted nucleotidyltransferase
MMSLTEEQKRIVLDILHRLVPDCQVSVFGSRAKGTRKPFADLDLLISGQKPLTLSTRAKLRDAFSESDLTFRVDVVDEKSASAEFLNAIRVDAVTIK